MIQPEAMIEERTREVRQALLQHGLYRRMRTLSEFRLFLEHHVYAVWDFMSLLKALQSRLTCTEVPWVPRGDPRVRALINEIVLAEESDTGCGEVPLSHFELYLTAMEEAGADTRPIRCFVERMACGQGLEAACQEAKVPICAQRFMQHTFDVIRTRPVHALAAAFTYGREGVIPMMFGEIVTRLDGQSHGALRTFRRYLDRHIVLDGDEHFRAGERMVALLCAGEQGRVEEAATAALDALNVRLAFWDAIPSSAVGTTVARRC